LLTDLYESVHHNQPILLISVGKWDTGTKLTVTEKTALNPYISVCYVSCLASSRDIAKGTYLMVG